MCLWKLAGGNSSCWCLWTILNKKSVGDKTCSPRAQGYCLPFPEILKPPSSHFCP